MLNLAYSKEYVLFIRSTYGKYNNVIVLESFMFFCVIYDHVTACDSHTNPLILSLKIRKWIEKKIEIRKKVKINRVYCFQLWYYSFLRFFPEKLTSISVSFSSTSLDTFFSNFLLSYLYNIFTIYFSSNYSLPKSFSSAIFNFFYCIFF